MVILLFPCKYSFLTLQNLRIDSFKALSFEIRLASSLIYHIPKDHLLIAQFNILAINKDHQSRPKVLAVFHFAEVNFQQRQV